MLRQAAIQQRILPPARRHVARAVFGTLPDSGGTVEQFTLTNAHGIEVRAISYGAIITSIRAHQTKPARSATSSTATTRSRAMWRDVSYFGAVGPVRQSYRARAIVLDGKTYIGGERRSELAARRPPRFQ
jgi:hypothetical protein